MNRIYKIIWNAHLSCMQVVSELAHCPQNAGSSMVAKTGTWGKWVIFNLALLPISVLAAVNATTLPIGGQVTQGSAQIHQQGNVLNIQQQSQHLNTQWQAFNIGQNATVNFKQPNASSVAVNQILDHNPSQIMGRLNANGQVFLINPNGMIFGSGSQVHVGGLVASTLKIEQHDALTQRFKLRGDAASQARIENHGHIIGGSVALLAPNVVNTGHITTPNGVTHLVAANQVSLLLQDGSLMQLQVEEGVLQGLVDNQGAIVADNGSVYLTAQGKDALSRAVVNHSGIIEANRLATNAQGEIVLLGDMQTGVTHVSGVLKAEGFNGQDGGFIETSAAVVNIANTAQVSTLSDSAQTGEWLIDPFNIVISAQADAGQTSNNNAFVPNQNDSVINVNTLQNALADNNITVTTAGAGGSQEGHIMVDAPITWHTNTDLTLSADQDIHIKQDITATHANAGLHLQYGQAKVNAGNSADYYLHDGAQVNLQAAPSTNANFSTKLGSDGSPTNYTVITALGNVGSATATDLQGMAGNLNGHYVLGADIDASVTSGWHGSQGFAPIGDDLRPFTGRLDGLGHTIGGLVVNRPAEAYTGLFGYIDSGAKIQNIGVVGGSITGQSTVGGLVGYSYDASISNAYATGKVTAASNTVYADVGGLVGYQDGGSIRHSHATGDVSSSNAEYANVGGLVGWSGGDISDAHATGRVTVGATDSAYAGGLVGWDAASIQNAYATGNVTAKADYSAVAGGLVGFDLGGSVDNAYATGAVKATAPDYASAGGLVGDNDGGQVENAYATGASTAESDIFAAAGGLVAWNGGTIDQTYATGLVQAYKQGVSDTQAAGGLVGLDAADAVTNSFWNIETTALNTSDGGSGAMGMTRAQMQNLNTFNQAAWDIDDAGGTGKVWRIYEGQTAPLLRSFFSKKHNVNVATTRTATYNGQAHAFAPNADLDPQVLVSGHQNSTATNAGTYQAQYYSHQQGYDLEGNRATALTINKAQLVLSGERVYDGSTTVQGAHLMAQGAAGETFTVVGAGDVSNLNQKHVGTGMALGSVVGLALGSSTNGGLAGNYEAISTQGSSFDVTQATVTLQAASDQRAYDGTTISKATVNVLGLAAGDTVTGLSQAFDSRNAGSRTLSVNQGYVLDDGNGGQNYKVVQNQAQGQIDKAVLNLQAASDQRVYDGTNTSKASVNVLGLAAGDTVTGLSQSFDSRNAGNRTLSVNQDYVLDDGNGGQNYNVVQNQAQGQIDKAVIQLVSHVLAENRAYDPNNHYANVDTSQAKMTGLVAGDQVLVTAAVGKLQNNQVGTQTVRVDQFQFGGADVGNYQWDSNMHYLTDVLITNVEPNVPNPGTGTPNPGTGTPNPGTDTPNPGTGTPNPGTGTPNPGTGTPNPGTGTPNPGTGTPNPGTGTPNPGTGTPNPGTGTPNPGTGTPNPGTGNFNVGLNYPYLRAVSFEDDDNQIDSSLEGQLVRVEVIGDGINMDGINFLGQGQ